MRIFYAANNFKSSYYALKQFKADYQDHYTLKTAAYNKSANDLHINYNLDALLNFSRVRNDISFKNSNFILLRREIEAFKPDLIISDVEIFSSYIALEYKIKLFLVSPLLLYYGTGAKQFGLFTKYSHLFINDHEHYIEHILNKADKKLILSHLGDLKHKPKILNDYEFVRPSYHYIDKKITTNGNIIDLASAYYSGIPSNIEPDYSDQISLLNSYYNVHHNLSNTDEPFDINIDPNIKFLSQYLKELI